MSWDVNCGELCAGICNVVLCGVLQVICELVCILPPGEQCVSLIGWPTCTAVHASHQMPLTGLVDACAQPGQWPALLCSKVEKERELQPPRSLWEDAHTSCRTQSLPKRPAALHNVGQHTLGQSRPTQSNHKKSCTHRKPPAPAPASRHSCPAMTPLQKNLAVAAQTYDSTHSTQPYPSVLHAMGTAGGA